MIYFVSQEGLRYVKIGYTTDLDTLSMRISAMQTGNPHLLTIIGTMQGERSEEARFHWLFRECKVLGEWFAVIGTLDRYIREHFLPVSAIPKELEPMLSTQDVTRLTDKKLKHIIELNDKAVHEC